MVRCDPWAWGIGMTGQAGFFNGEKRLQALSSAGDPLEPLAQVMFHNQSLEE
jgi:hypothetical protein